MKYSYVLGLLVMSSMMRAASSCVKPFCV